MQRPEDLSPPGDQPPVADGTTRWGFLGAGRISRTALGPAVQASRGAVLQAVGARDVDRARDLADAHGAPSAYGSYDEVLADDDVEAVYVALANDAHVPWTLRALEAGKDVLCEKPLGPTAQEVAQVRDAARDAGRTVVEASWYRWHPQTALAHRLLREGAVGAVRHVAAGFTFAGVPEGDFRLEVARGGGALADVGCYAVSAVLAAVAHADGHARSADALPDEVVCRTRDHPGGVDLAADVLLVWHGAGGPQGEPRVEAEVRAGIDEAPSQWCVVRGDAGELERRPEPFTAYLGREAELLLSDGAGTERVVVAWTDAYRLMVEEVSSALRGGPGRLLDLDESWATAAVLDAARASAASGGEPVRPGR